jgi:hypothetical protein
LGAPTIGPLSLNPFPVGNPAGAFTFPVLDLSHDTEFRTPTVPGLTGVTQEVINDPNSVLDRRTAVQRSRRRWCFR